MRRTHSAAAARLQGLLRRGEARDASAFASNKARASRSHSSSPSSSQDILAATLPERFYIAYLATTRLVVVKRGQRTFNRGLGATSTPVKCPAGAIGRRR